MLIFKWIPQTVYKNMVMIVGEVIGTAILIFIGCSGVAHFNGAPPALGSPINFGLAVMMVILIYGHLSHAILNPAVAVAAVVNGLISWQMGIIYIISECIGASIGYGLLALLSPNELFCLGSVNGMCLTLINESFTVTQGFFIEFFATSTLVAVVCAIWDKRTPDDGAAVKIGLTVFTLSYAFGVQTGASLNPARSFGPALYNSNWENHWVYWASPLSAGLITSVGYKIFFMQDYDAKGL